MPANRKLPKKPTEEAPSIFDEESSDGVVYATDWSEYVTRVPLSIRQGIAEKVRAADLSTHEGYRALNLLLLGEFIEGNLPMGIVKAVDILLKNAFASMCVEKDKSGGGNFMMIERLIMERRTQATLPAETLYTSGKAAPERVLLKEVGDGS